MKSWSRAWSRTWCVAGLLVMQQALAAEPETLVIGGPPKAGPNVVVDFGAIDEAMGRERAARLVLRKPGTKAMAATPGQIQLHRPGHGKKLAKAAVPPPGPKESLPPIKPAATESLIPTNPGLAQPAQPTPKVASAPLTQPVSAPPAKPVETPKVDVPKVDVPKVETPKAEAPKAEAVKPPAETKVASLAPQTAQPPAAGSRGATAAAGGPRLTFASESEALDDAARASLDAIADKMRAGEGRAQIMAYAAGSADQASAARRLSLKRALSVREYMIAKGIKAQRMDLRALGNESGEGPPDRVDIVLDAR